MPESARSKQPHTTSRAISAFPWYRPPLGLRLLTLGTTVLLRWGLITLPRLLPVRELSGARSGTSTQPRPGISHGVRRLLLLLNSLLPPLRPRVDHEGLPRGVRGSSAQGLLGSSEVLGGEEMVVLPVSFAAAEEARSTVQLVIRGGSFGIPPAVRRCLRTNLRCMITPLAVLARIAEAVLR